MPSPRKHQPDAPRRVVMLVYPGTQILDITGPLEVFGRTARWVRDRGLSRGLPYTVEMVAAEAGPFTTSSGLRLMAERSYREVIQADTLLIAGGIGYAETLADTRVLAWLRSMAGKVRRVGSICTGALILAESGLLQGRRATTHWEYTGELAAYRGVKVDPDAIYVRDGRFYSSAGVTAGMDMALAMVEEDWGQPVSLAVAQELVLFLKRPGGQSQFSEDDKLRELQLWMLDHLEQDLSVPRLAERMAMSERNFARRFVESTGATPAQYVSRIRLEAARRKLEQGRLQVSEVARRCGFGSQESMRRVFVERLGVPPGDYRERFRGASLG